MVDRAKKMVDKVTTMPPTPGIIALKEAMLKAAPWNSPVLQISVVNIINAEKVQITMVVKNTSNMPQSPCFTGLLVLDAA